MLRLKIVAEEGGAATSAIESFYDKQGINLLSLRSMVLVESRKYLTSLLEVVNCAEKNEDDVIRAGFKNSSSHEWL